MSNLNPPSFVYRISLWGAVFGVILLLILVVGGIFGVLVMSFLAWVGVIAVLLGTIVLGTACLQYSNSRKEE